MNTFLLLIIGLNVLISYRSFDNQLMEKLLFSPYLIKYNNQWYRLFTHSWIHADWQHLLFNMVSLFYIGDVLIKECWIPAYGEVEGMVLFLILYIIGGVAATVLPYLKNKENYSYRALGASGAVSAVIFAAILWQPNMPLGLLFIPFSIPAYIFGPLYLLIEYFAMRNIKTGVAHDAHLGGALFGILFVLFLNLDKGKDFVNLFF